MQKVKQTSVQTMVMGAILTALVILLQCLATYTTFFGPFSTAIGLIPIVIGAAKCGPKVSAWLGLVFGAVVLLTGGGALFFAFNIPGTIITVLAKGIACGLAAGLVYKLLEKVNFYLAVVAAAVVCPVVNTGVFLLGCAVFFLPHAEGIASAVGLTVSGMEVFFALAMANFLFEVGMNLVLSPIIVRVLNIAKKK
ncbi:MAG: ECF transporter S component [Clostridia bacterium]|nr:ECF transporter S component [Clostridia bacterium]